MTPEAMRQLIELLVRYAGEELDQHEGWRIPLADGELFVRLSLEPGSLSREYYLDLERLGDPPGSLTGDPIEKAD